MKYTTGEYDPITNTIPVRFYNDHGYHDREVTACRNIENKFDADATHDRIKTILRGYPHKVSVGAVILTPHVSEEPTPVVEEAVEEVPVVEKSIIETTTPTKPKKSKKK
jgi:hypothetical protein